MSIIGLKKANCKNCYKCVKVCPVKSIKVENEQAKIIDRDCILCGTCLEQCPQNAKTVVSDVALVKEMLRGSSFRLLPRIMDALILTMCINLQAPSRSSASMAFQKQRRAQLM